MQSVSKPMKAQNLCPDDNDKNLKGNGRKSILFLLTPKASVAFLNEHCTLRQGLEKMRHHGYTAIPVIAEDGTYAGTVSEGDFLWHVLDSGMYSMKSQEDYSISDILRNGWNPAVRIDTTVDELLLRIMDQNFVPVIDDRGKFIGIITRKDVIKYYYSLIPKGELKGYMQIERY
ncbi:CBS domain-containing protein [Desulfitobacterium sp. AusDCA]|uniref:CBS domain-containing protein n=1 Tax=Desulfitobacterium sp. AusDCA TaxID=3240383 RepID=UPI003DA70527